MKRLALFVVAATLAVCVTASPDPHHKYCIIGAGPGGLQMSYFMKASGLDYIVFERNATAANFFKHYPRHRHLISINKRFTGRRNREFNMRHDWNSLLSTDHDLEMRYFSNRFFPLADELVEYMETFANSTQPNIVYGSTASNIRRRDTESNTGFLVDIATRTSDAENTHTHSCDLLIDARGITKPYVPNVEGTELLERYDTMSTNLTDYDGKTVMIIGRGNAGFETAQALLGHVNFMHVVGRSRLRLSYETHYVGDVRAVNNDLLDTYQLKSLDGMAEVDAEELNFFRTKDGLISSDPTADALEDDPESADYSNGELLEQRQEGSGFRTNYDAVILCLGWVFDDAPYAPGFNPQLDNKHKYPAMKRSYESHNVSGLYFAGGLQHAHDRRKSAGGFIHGYRYLALALFNHLNVVYEKARWPSVEIQTLSLADWIIKRAEESSSLYQMFRILCDVIVMSDDLNTVSYVYQVPCNAMPTAESYADLNVTGRVFTLHMDYGKGYSHPGADVFRRDRAQGDYHYGAMSNFLHPILRYFDWRACTPKAPCRSWSLPTEEHHLIEEFTTDFTLPVTHVYALRRFLEHVLQQPVTPFSSEHCLSIFTQKGRWPSQCASVHRHRGKMSIPNY